MGIHKNEIPPSLVIGNINGFIPNRRAFHRLPRRKVLHIHIDSFFINPRKCLNLISSFMLSSLKVSANFVQTKLLDCRFKGDDRQALGFKMLNKISFPFSSQAYVFTSELAWGQPEMKTERFMYVSWEKPISLKPIDRQKSDIKL